LNNWPYKKKKDPFQSLLGQLLETFIYQELRKYADWHHESLNFYHFRNKDKVEIDI